MQEMRTVWPTVSLALLSLNPIFIFKGWSLLALSSGMKDETEYSCRFCGLWSGSCRLWWFILNVSLSVCVYRHAVRRNLLNHSSIHQAPTQDRSSSFRDLRSAFFTTVLGKIQFQSSFPNIASCLSSSEDRMLSTLVFQSVDSCSPW